MKTGAIQYEEVPMEFASDLFSDLRELSPASRSLLPFVWVDHFETFLIWNRHLMRVAGVRYDLLGAM